MSNLLRHERSNRRLAYRETSSVYNDEFLIETSPSDRSYSVSWENILTSPTVQRHKRRNYPFYITPATNESNKESMEGVITEWPEKTDPSTQEDLLYSEEEQIQEFIFRIKTSLFIPYRERLANRLLTLFKDAKEEDPDSPGISVSSLRNFYNFLQLHGNVKCPTISLTPYCNIYTSWRSDQKRVFSVHFLPNGDVRFVIFKPNDRHPEKKIRISGTATTDILKETVAPYGVWNWISE
ncbi:MAG: hypothetical protein E3K32_11260 [wastewater metagenome]|nr:hypothetical protein [Candidatus Loosdrechtia aerotolerans]